MNKNSVFLLGRRITEDTYDNTFIYSTSDSGNTVVNGNGDETINFYADNGIHLDKVSAGDLELYLHNIPTTTNGLTTDRVWSSNGVLRIYP